MNLSFDNAKKLIRGAYKQQLRDIVCAIREVRDAIQGAAATTFVPVTGGTSSVTIQSSGTASETVTPAAADNIRGVSVDVGAISHVTIAITFSDASTFTHTAVGIGSYSYEAELNHAPITSIVVTELDDVATPIIINYWSIG